MSKEENPSHGDIFWADLEPVKGSEQGGHRPVFVVSNNMMNQVSPVVLAVPMTRTPKVIPPFIIPYDMDDLRVIEENVKILDSMGFHFHDTIKNANILCQQARSISKDRLIIKVGSFNTDKYAKQVKQAINFLYAIDGCDKCHFPLRPDGLSCKNCGKIHRKKCKDCSRVISNHFKYCPYCGKEERNLWRR
ncbi:type II toxin-antitoxin system PemK/MazF family toxin [Bacillaceae bacterium CLA-AA-H227]|uniref:Type II toxin-antitoxin system PemK/MazF family toxin n=1 Tax=Robertmurraya yapensis (ex Hitch et al 2024) TaxID=3133160 RepID=A0ACC6SG32_9BACI